MSDALLNPTFAQHRRPDRDYWTLTWAMIALALISALAYTLDPRTLNDVSVWSKPLKFQLSIAMHLVTLGLIAAQLSDEWRNGRLARIAAATTTAAVLFEIGYITLQAARGEASHFNVSTPAAGALYALMGVMATALIAAACAIGWVAWRDRAARFGPATRLGAALGLGLGFILTLIIGAYIGGNGGHHVGEQVSDALALPLLGWSTVTGDLRPSHFFALHTMQALPLIGLAADRLGSGRWAVWAGALLATMLTVAAFLQALAGEPLLAL